MKTKTAVRVVHIGDDVQTDDSRHKRLGDVIGIFFFLLLLFFFFQNNDMTLLKFSLYVYLFTLDINLFLFLFVKERRKKKKTVKKARTGYIKCNKLKSPDYNESQHQTTQLRSQ